MTTQSKVIVGLGHPAAVPFPARCATTSPDRRREPRPRETGQPWAPIKGIWGEEAGAAGVVTPDPISPSYALIRSGRGAGSVAMTAAHVTEGMGIAFRCEDELNCWTLTAPGRSSAPGS